MNGLSMFDMSLIHSSGQPRQDFPRGSVATPPRPDAHWREYLKPEELRSLKRLQADRIRPTKRTERVLEVDHKRTFRGAVAMPAIPMRGYCLEAGVRCGG